MPAMSPGANPANYKRDQLFHGRLNVRMKLHLDYPNARKRKRRPRRQRHSYTVYVNLWLDSASHRRFVL